jgi:hypothetical protein
MLDGNGHLVAPARQYIIGVNSYAFSEKGPVTGVRVAVLVRANYDNFICTQELITTPAVIYGLFLSGKTYFYDLYPQIQKTH